MRDTRIDLLRFIGLSMIIFAHTDPPSYLFQLRNFDVPLMVLTSGMSFFLVSGDTAVSKNDSYLFYVWKRIKRLVFPVWIFLTLLFCFMYFTAVPAKLPDYQTIKSSYFLSSGIGYVWVIRVFLFVALVSPLILKVKQVTKNNQNFSLILLSLYLIYEIFLFLAPSFMSAGLGLFFVDILHYLIPYSIVFSIGVLMLHVSRQRALFLAMCFSVIFVFMVFINFYITGKIVPTQVFKYPPTLYYLSYALGISFLLWSVSAKLLTFLDRLRISSFIFFVAQNSIWIYLWHIPFVMYIKMPFYFKYPLIYFCAVSIFFLQVRLINLFVLPRVRSLQWRRNINLVLTG